MGYGFAATAVVGGLGLSRSGAAVPVGLLLSSAYAVLAAVLILRAGVGLGPGELFRRVLSLAVLTWGCGQLVVLGLVLAAPRAYPTPGDLISSLAAPLVVTGLLLLPRRETAGRLRMFSEALMIGSASATVVWLFWLRERRGGADGAAEVADWLAAGLLAAELVVVAMLVVAAVRDMDTGLVLGAAGLVLYVVGDMAPIHLATTPAPSHLGWLGPALSCLAWPLVMVGVARVDAAPGPLSRARASAAEQRRTAATFAATVFPLAAVLAHVLVESRVDPVTVVLVSGVVVGSAGRELIRARQSRLMLDVLDAQANGDPLTGLGNRRAMATRLAQLRLDDRPAAVLALDIDRFKDVNSQLGSGVGDAVLAAVGREVAAVCSPAGARAYRLGGDEFAVLLPAGVQDAERLAGYLQQAVRDGASRVSAPSRYELSSSVGIAGVGRSDHDGDPLDALTRAGEALRTAKSDRAGVAVYTAELDQRARRRARTERRLRVAVDTGSLEIHFQPIIDFATGSVAGVEALARWHDDELGHVPPDVFIGVAEQTGLIGRIGHQAMVAALEMAKSQDVAGHRLDVGVNVSPIQLRSPGFVQQVAELLERYGHEPRRFVLEVTEGIFMDRADPAVHALGQIADLGVTVAIDDFGSGYSSFGYMTRLPVNTLKIDRSLVSHLEDERNQSVVRGIIAMTTALGLDVVIEGVETQEAAAFLRSCGATYGQGWLYSAAVPASAVPRLLQRLGSVAQPLHPVLAASPVGA